MARGAPVLRKMPRLAPKARERGGIPVNVGNEYGLIEEPRGMVERFFSGDSLLWTQAAIAVIAAAGVLILAIIVQTIFF